MPGRFPAIGSEMRKPRFFPYNVRAKKMFQILWDGEIGGDEVVRAEIPEVPQKLIERTQDGRMEFEYEIIIY